MEILKKFATAIIMLILTTQSAFALDWNDTEWRKRGCPEGLQGIWKAETTSQLAGQEMEFRKDGTLLIIEPRNQLRLTFKGDLKAGNRRFIELEIISGPDDVYPPFMKARPHLGPGAESPSSATESSCRIKIFRYENRVRAKQNREHSWDIYHAVK